MPFVITRKEDEKQQDPQSQGGFSITPREEVEDTSFNFLKDIAGPAKEFGIGALDLASRAFGGGPDSMMFKHEEWRQKEPGFTHDIESALLKKQGLSSEEILGKIGERPVDQKVLTPSEGIDELTGGAMLPVTARQRASQTSAREAGEFATAEAIFPVGSGAKQLAKWAGIGGLFGLGEQMAEEAGGGEGTKIGTGAAFALAPFIISKGKKGFQNALEWTKGFFSKKGIPEGTPKFLEQVATPMAEADLKLSSKDLTGRVAKTSEEMVERLDTSLDKVAKPSFKDVGTFRAADIEADIIKGNQKAILDTISPAGETQKKSVEGVTNYVESNFKGMKEGYKNLYESAEEIAKTIKVEASETANASKNLSKELKGSLLRIQEEQSLSSVASKLSKKTSPSLEGKAKKLVKDLADQEIKTDLQEVLKFMKDFGETPEPQMHTVDVLMKTKRAINRLLKKSDIIPAPVDLLKPISSALKRDILKGLEGSKGKGVYEAAEKMFSDTQKVYNNDFILKMRKSQNPEDLMNLISKPSNHEKLKDAIGKNKKVQDLVDRLVVENIASKGKAAAQEMAKESREFLSDKANKSLNNILEYGNTLTNPGAQEVARGRILNDLQQTMSTGSRPTETLNLMRNKTGYDLVKDSLDRSPKGRKMWKSLQRQTFEDMMESVLNKDGIIDFEKARDIFSDNHLQKVVKEALGPDGSRFFTQLEQYGKNMSQNIKNLASKETGMFEKIAESYIPKAMQYALYSLIPYTHGASLLPIIGKIAVKKAYKNQLYKLLENPKGRSLVKEMGQKNVSSGKMKSLLKEVGKIANEVKDTPPVAKIFKDVDIQAESE